MNLERAGRETSRTPHLEAVAESRAHAGNLEAMLAESTAHAGNLEPMLAESTAHATNLERALSSATVERDRARRRAKRLRRRLRVQTSSLSWRITPAPSSPSGVREDELVTGRSGASATSPQSRRPGVRCAARSRVSSCTRRPSTSTTAAGSSRCTPSTPPWGTSRWCGPTPTWSAPGRSRAGPGTRSRSTATPSWPASSWCCCTTAARIAHPRPHPAARAVARGARQIRIPVGVWHLLANVGTDEAHFVEPSHRALPPRRTRPVPARLGHRRAARRRARLPAQVLNARNPVAPDGGRGVRLARCRPS